MNDKYVLNKAFCCPGLQNGIAAAGQRGMAILVKLTPSGVMFLLQSRGIGFEDECKIRPKPDAPDIKINVSSEIGFQYCPWCGTRLQKLIKRSPEFFEDLARKHETFLPLHKEILDQPKTGADAKSSGIDDE